jgi:hypothetical protein
MVPVVGDLAVSTSIYSYYSSIGYALFWPDELGSIPEQILDNMYSGNVTTYNITLPRGDISCEPLLSAYFNLDYNSRIDKLMNDTYLAHEARYNATEQFVAFSEGASPIGFLWEWVVTTSGDKWVITNGQKIIDAEPIIYTKVSLSFLSIYNSTFARDMSIYLEKICPEPTNGYNDGADFKIETALASVIGSIGCNTNGLILSAAKHALLP